MTAGHKPHLTLKKLFDLKGKNIVKRDKYGIDCDTSDAAEAPYAECICVFDNKAIYLDDYGTLYVDRLIGENTQKGDVYPSDVRRLPMYPT